MRGQIVLMEKKFISLFILLLIVCGISFVNAEDYGGLMIDSKAAIERIQDHLKRLTITIGERSVYKPENLKRTEEYIVSFYQDIGLPVKREPYQYHDFSVANIVAEISFCENPSTNYLLGAHYDSVAGTVGADDNASGVAGLTWELLWQHHTAGAQALVELQSSTVEGGSDGAHMETHVRMLGPCTDHGGHVGD